MPKSKPKLSPEQIATKKKQKKESDRINDWNVQGGATYNGDIIQFGTGDVAWTTITGTGTMATTTGGYVSVKEKKSGIEPRLYFKYVKSKFTLIERFIIDRKLKNLEDAYYKAAENGQDLLARKFLNLISLAGKEALMLAKGVKMYIDKETLNKHKHKLKDGHISDTYYQDYTRLIPEDVIKRRKEVEGIFDSYVIYHYWNEDQRDIKAMSKAEKDRMKDPILFGRINESPDNLYFIADWEDEYCDLTFDEVIDVLGKDNVGQITKKVSLIC